MTNIDIPGIPGDLGIVESNSKQKCHKKVLTLGPTGATLTVRPQTFFSCEADSTSSTPKSFLSSRIGHCPPRTMKTNLTVEAVEKTYFGICEDLPPGCRNDRVICKQTEKMRRGSRLNLKVAAS